MEHKGQKLCFRPPARDTFLYLDAMPSGGMTLFPRGVSWSILESLSIIARQRIPRPVHFFFGAWGARHGKTVLSASRSGPKFSISMRCRLGGRHDTLFSLVESSSIIAHQRMMNRGLHPSPAIPFFKKDGCCFVSRGWIFPSNSSLATI
jgi:hypothetical protein